jgi:hypothetical protein
VSAAANPYAAFGGGTITPPPAVDPYAAFGGASLEATQTQPAQTPGQYPLSGPTGPTTIEAGKQEPSVAEHAVNFLTNPVDELGQGITKSLEMLKQSDNLRARAAGETIGQHLDAVKELWGIVGPEISLLTGAQGAAELAPELSEVAASKAGSMASNVVTAARNVGRKALLDPVTGEPTITPTSIAKRALRDPKEIESAAYEKKAQALMDRGYEQAKLDAAHEQRLKEIEDARQKELAANERLREQEARSREMRGKQQEAIDKKTSPAPAEKPKPFAGVTYSESTAPNAPAKTAATPAQELVGRQTASRTATRASSGSRPSDAEEYITQLMHKPILTEDEFADTEKILGPQARIKPGEGTAAWRARVLGLVRAGRASRGMREPGSFPIGE